MKSNLKLSKYVSEEVLAKLHENHEEFFNEDPDVLVKSIGSSDVIEKAEIDSDERTVVKYISTVKIDRDNDIILPDGIVTEDFQKNPVILWAHNYWTLPIGKALWIKADKFGLKAKIQYAKHEFADDVFNMHKDGFPLAASIGFIPLEVVRRTDENWEKTAEKVVKKYKLEKEYVDTASRIYTKVLLLEDSDVPVPANQDALTLALAKDIMKTEEMKDIFREQIKSEFVDKFTDALTKMGIPVQEATVALMSLIKTYKLKQDEEQEEKKEETKTETEEKTEPEGLTKEKVNEILDRSEKDLLDKISDLIDYKLSGKV